MPKPPPNGKRRREGALEIGELGPSTKRLKRHHQLDDSALALIQGESEVGIEHVLALCGLGPLAKTPTSSSSSRKRERSQRFGCTAMQYRDP